MQKVRGKAFYRNFDWLPSWLGGSLRVFTGRVGVYREDPIDAEVFTNLPHPTYFADLVELYADLAVHLPASRQSDANVERMCEVAGRLEEATNAARRLVPRVYDMYYLHGLQFVAAYDRAVRIVRVDHPSGFSATNRFLFERSTRKERQREIKVHPHYLMERVLGFQRSENKYLVRVDGKHKTSCSGAPGSAYAPGAPCEPWDEVRMFFGEKIPGLGVEGPDGLQY